MNYIEIYGGNNMNRVNMKEYYDIFKNVLSIAEESKKEYDVKFKELDTDGDGFVKFDLSKIDVDDLLVKGKKKELFDYLNSLDYEIVKILYVIMYIGRDSSCAEEDGSYNYVRTREWFDERGWNKDKCAEVEQMLGKVYFVEYLKAGFEKLDMQI